MLLQTLENQIYHLLYPVCNVFLDYVLLVIL